MINKKMNKKAMSIGDFFYWIGRMLFVILILVSIVYVGLIYQSKAIESYDIEAKLFKHYLIYNPNGLSYWDDSTGRLYPGIVDLKNFNSERLEAAADFGTDRMVAANITLYDISKTTVIAQTYYNYPSFIRWKPISYGKGAGSVYKDEGELYVIYVNESSRKAGILKTEVLVPRT